MKVLKKLFAVIVWHFIIHPQLIRDALEKVKQQ